MHHLRYIFVPWSAVLVYTLFSAIMGQNGIYARQHLEAEWLHLTENHRMLENTYSEFQKTKESLMYDQDALSVYARQLGYGRRDEGFIRIMDLGIALNNNLVAGQVLYATDPIFVDDKTIKILSALFGLAIFVFFLVMDFLTRPLQ